MSVQSAQAKLSKGSKDLMVQWVRVGASWRDPVGVRFEEEFIAPMEQNIKQASTAMSGLAETLRRVRRDCS